jgi:hypothetical protein
MAAYEYLYIVAYRLIGKQYANRPVETDATLTRGQRIFCLLFPLLATLAAMVGLWALWVYTYVSLFPHVEPATYYLTAPLWHIGLQIGAILLPLLASPAYFDLWRVYRLLHESAHHPPNQARGQSHGGKYPE